METLDLAQRGELRLPLVLSLGSCSAFRVVISVHIRYQNDPTLETLGRAVATRCWESEAPKRQSWSLSLESGHVKR